MLNLVGHGLDEVSAVEVSCSAEPVADEAPAEECSPEGNVETDPDSDETTLLEELVAVISVMESDVEVDVEVEVDAEPRLLAADAVSLPPRGKAVTIELPELTRVTLVKLWVGDASDSEPVEPNQTLWIWPV